MTKIYYQGTDGAYMHQAATACVPYFDRTIDEIIGLSSFEVCWETLLHSDTPDDSILIIATENSIAGAIHENLYRLAKYDIKIIGEYSMVINHCLCSHEDDISKITKVYSHYVALPQCQKYLKSHQITNQIVHPDTAGAAKMISQSKESGAGAICSTLAAQMYGLHILDENIQDSANNITRFIILTQKTSNILYSEKQYKTSILCIPDNLEFALYSCLGVFAKRNIPITKIESLPNPENPFSYMFLIDFIDKTQQDKQEEIVTELSHYAKHIRVIGTY